jgi:beta-galactosidase
MRAEIPREYAAVSWYGRGPHENYVDRKRGAAIACYAEDAGAMEHRYLRPQENGNRSDVRTFALRRADGTGFCCEAGTDSSAPASVFRDEKSTALSFSVQKYSQQKIDKAAHLHELEEDPFLTLNIDGYQRGVGGDLPGCTYLHTPYKLPHGTYAYSFVLRRSP